MTYIHTSSMEVRPFPLGEVGSQRSFLDLAEDWDLPTSCDLFFSVSIFALRNDPFLSHTTSSSKKEALALQSRVGWRDNSSLYFWSISRIDLLHKTPNLAAAKRITIHKRFECSAFQLSNSPWGALKLKLPSQDYTMHHFESKFAAVPEECKSKEGIGSLKG